MTDITERPISKDEVADLMLADQYAYTIKRPDGKPVYRNAETRREYYVRAEALRYMLKNTQWIDPSEDVPENPVIGAFERIIEIASRSIHGISLQTKANRFDAIREIAKTTIKMLGK